MSQQEPSTVEAVIPIPEVSEPVMPEPALAEQLTLPGTENLGNGIPDMSESAKDALVQALMSTLADDETETWNALAYLGEEDIVVAQRKLGKLLMSVIAHGSSFELRRVLTSKFA